MEKRPLGPGQDMAPVPHHVLHLAAKRRLYFWVPGSCFEDDSWEEMHKQKIITVGLLLFLCRPLVPLQCKEMEG